jgi:hypothetical protein
MVSSNTMIKISGETSSKTLKSMRRKKRTITEMRIVHIKSISPIL